MIKRLPGSFRDPNGFLYKQNGTLFRQINSSYQEDYQQLINSGLYELLSSQDYLVKHTEIDKQSVKDSGQFKTIQPDLIPFISYPYEWSFSQLKDAALLTLDIQSKALSKGMTLKDASAYNIQFKHHKPVFIDTLSFERYVTGEPWVAYKQFCQHFLAPLALMAHVDVRLSQLFRVFVDGVPLDLASKMLPAKTKFNPALFLHIHLHAKSQVKYSDSTDANKGKNVAVKEIGLLGIIDGLKRAIAKLQWQPKNTEWGDYYAETNYTDEAREHKKNIVREMVASVKPNMTWDLGANTGEFSHEASNSSQHVISWDIDDAAVEKHYLQLKQSAEPKSVLPLRLDLTNPSNAMGWGENERQSLLQRGKVDLIMALALVHHLAISNNVPLDMIADYFAKLGRHLIIEFVPKSDSQTKKLLSSREDVFDHYNLADFKVAFGQYFDLVDQKTVGESERSLLLYSTKK